MDTPGNVIFWSGAGISRDPPSSLPLGEELTRNVVEDFCLPNTWRDIIFLMSFLYLTLPQILCTIFLPSTLRPKEGM